MGFQSCSLSVGKLSVQSYAGESRDTMYSVDTVHSGTSLTVQELHLSCYCSDYMSFTYWKRFQTKATHLKILFTCNINVM